MKRPRRRLVAPFHRIIHGHCIDVLRQFARQSIQCVITSPPYYGLRGYGTIPQIWNSFRPCKHEWTCYLPGKRQRWGNTDTLSAKQRSNRGSLQNVAALERSGGRYCFNCNAWEGELGQEACAGDYVRHLCEAFDSVRDVLRDDGTVFLNLGDSSCLRAEEDAKQKDMLGVPWRVALELRRRGWYLRNAVIWDKPNGFVSSVEDRFTPTYETVFVLSKRPDYYFDFESVKEPTTDGKGMRRRRDVWRIPTKGYRENDSHYATFPEELVEVCMLAGSREGDTVLDLFGGSGTVSAVAKRLKRRSISIDLNTEYIALSNRRVHGK
jgi:site-specific DNA-methyltransferase (cytosine-N4-specific)